MMTPGHGSDAHVKEREAMVRQQIASRGIRDARVLDAFRRVPRELFVPESSISDAYKDHPVSIGRGQTVSQPYMVALMLAELKLQGHERVLEIGTGSAYQTALLAELCAMVYSIERIPELAQSARCRLTQLGYENVRCHVGDGTLGWEEESPFDAIVVSAAAPRVPSALDKQLAEGGRMAVPVGGIGSQDLIVLERRGGKTTQRSACPCVFVKLIGKDGWGGQG